MGHHQTMLSLFASDARPDITGPLLLVALLLILVIAVLKSRDPRRRETLQGLAKRLGGTYIEGNWLGQPRVDFVIAGRDATLEFFGGSKSTPPYTKVLVDIRGRSPGTLHILRDGFGQSFLKLFGAQDLKIGDAVFDKDYVVKATPESVAARIFAPERRSAVIRTVEKLRGYSDPTFDMDLEKLQVRVWRYLREERDMVTLAETATEFLGYVLATEGKAAASEGLCLICGTSLRDQVVRCERCRLSYHAACWAYMGRCASYACPGTRARA
jgi:hypothetical protein